ncbi:MAG: hypothetical protein V5A84_00960 [Planctomycetota bacterium]
MQVRKCLSIIVVFAALCIATAAQSAETVSVNDYRGWQPTGKMWHVECERDDHLSWKITENQRLRPYYRGFALARQGIITKVEFDFEVKGKPKKSVRLELYDGIGRPLWTKKLKQGSGEHVSLSGEKAYNGLEFRLAANAHTVKKGTAVTVKNVTFTETNVGPTKTREFSDDFSGWKETSMRGGFESSAEDELYFKTTKKTANDSNGWARGYRWKSEDPITRIEFDLSCSSSNRMALKVIDGRGQVMQDNVEDEHVVLEPVHAVDGIEIRYQKNDYIIYGGWSARVDNVKLTTATSLPPVRKRVQKGLQRLASNFVNKINTRLAQWALPHPHLPQGGIEVTDSNHVIDHQPGYLSGKWLLFHDGAWVRFKGSGYLRVRWEVEHWVNAGRIQLPDIQGAITPIGGGGHVVGTGPSYPEIGYINKYYYVYGQCGFRIHEGAAYNLGISPTNYASVRRSLKVVY